MKNFNLALKAFVDSRWAQRLLLPLAIYNISITIIRILNEKQIIRDVVNENQDFYSALATMNFNPVGNLGILQATMLYDKTLTFEQINEIANKVIISVILKFVNDENLLGILYIDCRLASSKVIVEIRPVSLKLLAIDVFDLSISLALTICVITLALIV